MIVFVIVIAFTAILIGLLEFVYRIGYRTGSRTEVTTMIELMDELKIDCWEQRIFKDRLKKALQWSLDITRKRDRDAKAG